MGIDHYRDDFVTVAAPGAKTCHSYLTAFEAECTALGVALAPEKKEGPTTRLVFLGIEVDTVEGSLSLHADKLSQLRQEVESWLGRRACQRRELESLVGVLQNAATRMHIRPTDDRPSQGPPASTPLHSPQPANPVLVESICSIMEWVAIVIAYPDHATKKCPLCDTTELNPQCLPQHFISEHTNSEGNWETLLNSLVTMDPSFYCHVLCFLYTSLLYFLRALGLCPGGP